MPAKDKFHDHVKKALVNDGWTITDDPLTFKFGKTDIYIDLGAERLLAAQKGLCQIAVEIKSFLSRSSIADLQAAIGQFQMYRYKLQKIDPERELWLAIDETVYLKLFLEAEVEDFRINQGVKLIVFNAQTEEILRWIP